MNYYAARLDDKKVTGIDSACFQWTIAKKWEIAFLICHDYLIQGIYEHEDGNRYYVDEITWIEYDMLIAFGVEGVTEFPATFPVD